MVTVFTDLSRMATLGVFMKLISILFGSMMVVAPVSCQQYHQPCPIIQGFEPIITKPGADLTIALMLDRHESVADPTGGAESICNFDSPTFGREQRETAAIAATDHWPDSIQLPGLTVGLEIYDMCYQYDVAQFSAIRYAQQRYNSLYANQTTCINDTLRLGVIGFERSPYSEALSNLLEPFGIPVMDFVSTSTELSNADKYPNFFRTVPPDTAAIKALVDILKSYDWTYATLIYNDANSYGLSGLQALEAAFEEEGFCLSNPITVSPGERSEEVYDGIVNQLIQQNAKVVILWASPFNIRGLFEAVDRIRGAAYDIQWVASDTALYIDFASLPLEHAKAARGLFVVSPYPHTNATFKTWLSQWYPDMEFSYSPTGLLIDVVHAYMSAFSSAHLDKCEGQPGICDALASIQGPEFIDYVRRVSFTGIDGHIISFDENGDPVHRYYEILHYRGTSVPDVYALQKVGEWTTDTGLTLNKDEVEFYDQTDTLTDPPMSTCEEGSCSDPRCQKPDNRTKFVIEGLFDLHGSGCNALRESRFTQVEAALYAVNQINQDSSLLPDIRLSMTVNDICGGTDDAERVALRSIQGWDIGDGFPSQNDDSYLMGMLHSGSSGKAVAESNILQIADLPLLASSATSPALSDNDMLRNFLRTVPSDTKQAAVIADILARLGLTYIQTINTRGVYGDGGVQVLKEAAEKAGICIANSFVVDSTTNFAMLLNSINGKPEARTLVLFLIDDHAQDLFEEMVKRNVASGQFQILASDTWGTRMDFIPGLEAQAIGALTVFSKTSTIPEFEDYFVSLTPETEDGSNPFFSEYWTQKFKCDLPNEDTAYDFPCTGSEMLQTNDANSLGMENIINVIHVYAVALSNLINSTCPDGGICDALYDVTSEKWFETLQAVDFISPVGAQKRVSFDENGNGAPLFSVYQLTQMNGAYRYEEIGTWDNVNGLSNLNDDIINSMFSSNCTGLCLECNPSPNQTSDQDYFRIPGDLDLPIVLQLSEPGDGVMCGASLPKKSLVLESLLYALDEVNNNPSVLPGVMLGVTVMDSCGNPAIATRKLVGLLGGFADLDDTGPTFAVLGPANPEVAEETARSITGPSKLPLVSHGAANPDLDNYPLVLSTSAPYINEVDAVVELLRVFGWKYVGVVYSETQYGRSNYQAFLAAAQEEGICLGAQHDIDDTTDFDAIISDFSSDDSLNVIVAFVNQKDARNLLIADELKRDKKFTWVGTDSWDHPALVSRLENAASGMLVVANEKPELPEISNFFADSDLLQTASLRDPYLRDYLQATYSCNPSVNNCQFDEQLQESLQELSGEISALLNAFYAVAHGANWLHDSKCGMSTEGLCEDFHSSSPNEVLNSIERVTLESGAGGKPFSFDGQSVLPVYSIKNYQFDGQSGQFVTVGEWRNNQLTLQETGIALDNPDAERAQSHPSGCSCDPIPVAYEEISLQLYEWKWINYGIWSTIVLALSAIGGVFALGIGIVFLSKRHSYVVQGASFSLSMWLLLGIILMYLLNLAYMFEVNPAICGIRRFGTSFVYCVAYAAIIVKSIRANRFAHKKPGVDLNFAGSWSQSLLFLAFLLPEVFLVGEWLILIPPAVSLTGGTAYDACGNNLPQPMCATSTTDLTIFMSYAYFLVLITFFSSIGALGASNSEHEGKSIFVTSLFSIFIQVAWACVYNLLDEQYGIPAISIGLTANATVILVFMFVSKMGSLIKKDEDDSGTATARHADMEDKPDKKIHVYDNAGATVEVGGEEITSF